MLKETINFRIHLISQSSINLYDLSDADWVGCLDTRRSTTGYRIFTGTTMSPGALKSNQQ